MQRCLNHKMRNVLGHLPKKLHDQARAVLRAAWKRGTTNLIDNAHSGMRQRMRRVTRWRDGSMVVRWAAASFMDAEQNYRKIMDYRDLWILKAHLDELTTPVAGKEVAP